MALPLPPSRVVLALGLLVAVGIILTALYVSLDHPSDSDLGPGPRAVDTLKFLVVVSRHGNKRALYTFPNDPYPPNHTIWHYGPGQLTTLGRQQAFKLGVKVRSLYNGFLSDFFYSEDVYASSTTVDRTLMSAEAFLAGLFPPKDFQRWSQTIDWQPVPVYADSLDKTSQVRSTNCSRYVQEKTEARKQFEQENAQEVAEVLSYAKQFAGSDTPGAAGLVMIWDPLSSEAAEGLPLPEWTGKLYPEPLTKLMNKCYLALFTGTEELTKLVIGWFYKNLLGLMQRKVDGSLTPDRKMFYFSGHDNSLVCLQAVLGVPAPSLTGLVRPGSALLYELHQNTSTKQFTVEVLYIDGASTSLEPVSLPLPDCGSPCTFERLVQTTQRFTDVKTFEQECQVTTRKKKEE